MTPNNDEYSAEFPNDPAKDKFLKMLADYQKAKSNCEQKKSGMNEAYIETNEYKQLEKERNQMKFFWNDEPEKSI